MLAFNTPPTVPSHIKLKPGVKQEQPVSYRVKIVAHTMIRGVVTYAGSVVEVLREDYKLLGMKCVLVDVNTPLFAAPQPPEPSDLFPAKIVELVGLGLNNPKDLANELRTTLGTVLKIAKDLIAEGKILVNGQGVYTLKKA